jgi:hypothetical protein
VKVKALEVDGTTVEISLDGDEFIARVGVELVRFKTLKGCEDAVRRRVREAVKLAIDATMVSDNGWRDEKAKFEDVVVTGLHGSNGNILYKDCDGDPRQSGYGAQFLRRLSTGEKADYLGLVRARRHAQDACTAWIDKHRMDVKQALEVARKDAGLTEEAKV